MHRFFRLLLISFMGIVASLGVAEAMDGVISAERTPLSPSMSFDNHVFLPIVTNGKASDVVTNGKLTLDLQFMDQVQLPNGQKIDWTPALKQPYVNAANKWLSALQGIEGTDTHTITIEITVTPLATGNGEAGVTEDAEVGQYVFPVAGEIIIASHTYEDDFDQIEFNANIIHEMGHVLGVGTITEDYTTHDTATNGPVFRGIETNRGVELYNQIYGTTVDFVPISDDRGHLYDVVLQEDQPRQLPDGSPLPSMTKEVMANGHVFGSVALGVLDDIGYIVDYSAAEIYVP